MADIRLDQLDDVRIAKPCPMRWEDLDGDGATRHCRTCDLDVHDFSQMTRDEVAAVIGRTEGRLCAALYRRADGTILTRDCPVGLRAARQRTARVVRRVAAALGVLLTGGFVFGRAHDANGRLRSLEPFAKAGELVSPPPIVMGAVAIPPQPCVELGEVVVMPRNDAP